MDPDSELITLLTVPASNGDEAADAAVLIRQEEEAHGNDVGAPRPTGPCARERDCGS